MPATVILLSGLPASGKTTTAARLRAGLGGTLIRSCDVFQELGISLPDWVRRTAGFTRDVGAYEAVRDGAYVRMLERLETSLAAGSDLVIVDAVHGEREKRETVYAACRRHRARPLVVLCRCSAWPEVRRRFAARHGRDHEPEHEAADLSVYRHLEGLWEDPAADPGVRAGGVPVLAYDTVSGRVVVEAGRADPVVDRVRAALLEARAGVSIAP